MPLYTLRNTIFFCLFSTSEHTIVELGMKCTSYKYRTWLQNPIAKSNLMETCDMLVGNILFPNSQVRIVNAILFAIGSASDFILFAIVKRWELWVQACEPTKLKGKGDAILVALTYFTCKYKERGTSRARLSLCQSGKPISLILGVWNRYRINSRSDRANQSAPDVFPGISNYSHNQRIETPSCPRRHLFYIMFSMFLCSIFSHNQYWKYLSLFLFFKIILLNIFYKNNKNYKYFIRVNKNKHI